MQKMQKLLLMLSVLLIVGKAASAQKVITRVVDNKGTIKWVLDSNTAVITKGDSTILYVTPKALRDSSAKAVKYTDTSAMLASYLRTADNGLTKAGQNVRLGGALNQVTTITTTAANFLQITGLQSGAATDSVMVVNPATGKLSIVSAGTLFANLTAGNGLTKTGNAIELGGALTKPTTITTTATNTLSVTGLTSGSLATDSIVVATAAGVFKTVSANSLLQSGDQSFTATAGQTSYAVTGLPAIVSRVWVFRNGAKLIATADYTVSANTVTLTPGGVSPNDWSVVVGDVIEVQWVK